MATARGWQPAVVATCFAPEERRDAPNLAPDCLQMAPASKRLLRFQHLRQAHQFTRVFRQRFRVTGPALQVLAAPQPASERARLGMAIARRNVRLSVDRVRLKRLIRESFRCNQDCLRGLDVVVMTRPLAASLEPSNLAAELADHWRSLAVSAEQRS